jgi:hypothetical protein
MQRDEEGASAHAHPFAWPSDQPVLATVGGHTTGAPVHMAPSPSATFLALQAAAPRDKDRAAILALCGSYRVSFDFQETVALRPGYHLAAPYQSWATERIFVLSDTPDTIVLQHQLVMRAIKADGTLDAVEVAKHWRQDWHWQPERYLRFSGLVGASERWQTIPVATTQRAGLWSWTVSGIDDEPRYAAIGRWQHDGNCSRWLGEETWRPLPRRERSRRSDYQVLSGSEQIIVAPDGWIMLQDNGKVVVPAAGQASTIVREIGAERYQHIQDFDWQPGIDAWKAAAPFWAEIRTTWSALVAKPSVTLATHTRQGDSLVMALAECAAAYADKDAAALSRAQTLIHDAASNQPTTGQAVSGAK